MVNAFFELNLIEIDNSNFIVISESCFCEDNALGFAPY